MQPRYPGLRVPADPGREGARQAQVAVSVRSEEHRQDHAAARTIRRARHRKPPAQQRVPAAGRESVATARDRGGAPRRCFDRPTGDCHRRDPEAAATPRRGARPDRGRGDSLRAERLQWPQAQGQRREPARRARVAGSPVPADLRGDPGVRPRPVPPARRVAAGIRLRVPGGGARRLRQHLLARGDSGRGAGAELRPLRAVSERGCGIERPTAQLRQRVARHRRAGHLRALLLRHPCRHVHRVSRAPLARVAAAQGGGDGQVLLLSTWESPTSCAAPSR